MRNNVSWLGGAIAADFCEVRLDSTKLTENRAGAAGGGIHFDHCTVEIGDSPSEMNSASVGGGINADWSKLTIDNSKFAGDTASSGAGLNVHNSDLVVNNSLFLQNEALSNGGAIWYVADSMIFDRPYTVKLTKSDFVGNNSAGLMAGVEIEQADQDTSLLDVLIDDCLFADNSADRVGTLRILGHVSDFVVSNSVLSGNTVARWTAGATFSSNSSGTVSNCLFVSNVAGGGTGTNTAGAAVGAGAAVDFLNCTFAYNDGGPSSGLSLRGPAVASLTNCIFWGNTRGQIAATTVDSAGPMLYVNYSDIQDGLDSITVNDSLSIVHWGTGNINADPLFADSAADDFSLGQGSPCIGAGIDTIEIAGVWHSCPDTDIEGNPRPAPPGTMPDMGAYEDQATIPVGVEQISDGTVPDSYALLQNYPNPFNPSTTIRFDLPEQADVTLKVYNVLGEEVVTLLNENQDPGYKSVEFDASYFASGVYIYRIQAGGFSQTKKMILIR
jgi:hypothetical protein